MMNTFLHLMRDTNFTSGIVQFYERYFSDAGHTICYIVSPGKVSPLNLSMKIKQIEYKSKGGKVSRFKDFIRLLREYDYIVLHNMGCLDNFTGLVYLLPKRIYKKKIIWIEWGGDLYTTENRKIKEILRNRVKESVKAVVAIFPPDADVYRRKFPYSKAKIFYAPYCGATIANYYKESYPQSSLAVHPKGEPIFVQIGNNAKEAQHHIEVLEALSRYKNDNIAVFLPIVYGGSAEYVNKVQSRAEALFPGKTYILREMMERKQYYDLLKKVDIAIFNTERQIGLGNLHFLIWKKAKIFMNHVNPMYDFFQNQGITICDYNEIKDLSFEDFCRPQKDYDEEKFNQYINSHTNMEERIKSWRTIYDDLDN